MPLEYDYEVLFNSLHRGWRDPRDREKGYSVYSYYHKLLNLPGARCIEHISSTTLAITDGNRSKPYTDFKHTHTRAPAHTHTGILRRTLNPLVCIIDIRTRELRQRARARKRERKKARCTRWNLSNMEKLAKFPNIYEYTRIFRCISTFMKQSPRLETLLVSSFLSYALFTLNYFSRMYISMHTHLFISILVQATYIVRKVLV